MYHDLPRDASFWSFLFEVDQDLAGEARKKRLHSADYPRKPRGASSKLPELQCFRLSFCCDRDGCRKRFTPPSVRFLGPKVYLGAIVILISAMRQGPNPRRVRQLSERFGADERTIARWQTFWREHFPQTPFWKVALASFLAVGEIVSLPYSLVDSFLRRHPPREGWILLLRFLSPITVPGGLQIKVSQ
jgi:hypothetical protein